MPCRWFISLFLFLVVATPCKATVQVFVVAGQSNAAGFGGNAEDLPPELQQPQDDVLFWYDVGNGGQWPPSDRHVRPMEGTSTWVTLRPQAEFDGHLAFDKATFNFTGQDITTGHGPEITLGRDLKDSVPGEIAIIKFAWGGTPLAKVSDEIDWNVESTRQYYYWMIQEVADAMNKLESQFGTNGHIAGLFWDQGESDTLSLERSEAYEQNLLAFVDGVREQWGPSLPVVITQLPEDVVNFTHPDYPPLQQDNITRVRTAQRNVVAARDLTALVDVDDIPMTNDHAHYYSAGYQAIGERFSDAYLSLVPQPGLVMALPPDTVYAVVDDDSDGIWDGAGDAVQDKSDAPRLGVGEIDRPDVNLLRRLVAKFGLPERPEGRPVLQRALLRFYLERVDGTPAGALSLWHSAADNDLEQRPSDYEDDSYEDTQIDLGGTSPTAEQYLELDVTDQVLADYASDGSDPFGAFRLQVNEAKFVEDDKLSRYVLTMPGGDVRPELLLTFIPEPSSLALATMALLWLGLSSLFGGRFCHRRNRSQATG